MNMRRAVLINAAGRYAQILLNVVLGAVLARILTPEEFGTVAVVTVFTTFFSLFSEMGIGAAIVQKKDLSKGEIADLSGFMFYVAIALCIGFFLASWPIALFYGNGIYRKIGWILSFSLFCNAMDTVPRGILNRDKRFVSIALRTVLIYTATAGAAIFLALRGWGVYALAVQSVLSSLGTWLWDAAAARPPLRLRISLAPVRRVSSYSGFDFAFSLVNYFARNLDNLLTGKYIGAAPLGYYNKAYNLMLYPVRNLSGAVTPVLHPLLSDYQDDKKAVYEKTMLVVRTMACMGLLLAPVCFLCAGEIIRIVYGPQWEASVVCFRWMSISMATQMVNSCGGAIFRSIGNTKLLFMNGTLNACINILAILAGIFAGKSINALAMCISLAYIMHFFTAWIMLVKLGFGYSLIAFFRQLLPEGILMLLMGAACAWNPVHAEQVLLSLACKGAYLLAVYAAGLLITGEYRLIVRMIRTRR